jgi:hypothetical protein
VAQFGGANSFRAGKGEQEVTALVLAMSVAAAPSHADRIPLRTAFHVHTTFSDGSHSLDELASRASQEDIDVIILSDHFQTRFEYGPPLFRKALAVSADSASLGLHDLSAYVEAAAETERQSGVLVIPGVEITPFYYWEGNPVSQDLTLNSAHRHLLVLFPDTPDIASLGPLLKRMSAPGIGEFGLGSLLLIWPLLPGVWALNRLLHDKRSLVLWLVVAGSVGALARSWPYRVPRHSPYANDAGAAPYQDALDASRPTATLTFWAHPEASVDFQHSRYPVTYRSEKYPELIYQTHGATGFAALYEGHRQTGGVGGAWDRALNQFSLERRQKPLWTVGELDLHEEGESGGKFLGQVETIILAKERSHRAVMDALREGAMYAVRQPGAGRLTLERFRAVCDQDAVNMGQRATVTSPCRIEAILCARGEPLGKVATTLVSNGEVVDERTIDIDEDGVVLTWHADVAPGRVSYFRLMARRGNNLSLFSNPVFLQEGERP